LAEIWKKPVRHTVKPPGTTAFSGGLNSLMTIQDGVLGRGVDEGMAGRLSEMERLSGLN
jgi:hypothetical protein